MEDKIKIIVVNCKEEFLTEMEWADKNSAKAFLFDLMMEGQKTGQYEVEKSGVRNTYIVTNYR